MNPAIYGLVQQAIINNIQPYLVYEGYKGLVEDQIVLANQQEVINHFFDSGTFIYSARLVEFKDLEVRKKAVSNLKAKKNRYVSSDRWWWFISRRKTIIWDGD